MARNAPAAAEVPAEPARAFPLEPVMVDPAPAYPPGVRMHEGGAHPYATERVAEPARDPRSPPPGWRGGFTRCGGCGDFLGNALACSSCAPVALPANVSNSAGPVSR